MKVKEKIQSLRKPNGRSVEGEGTPRAHRSQPAGLGVGEQEEALVGPGVTHLSAGVTQRAQLPQQLLLAAAVSRRRLTNLLSQKYQLHLQPAAAVKNAAEDEQNSGLHVAQGDGKASKPVSNEASLL